MKFDLTQPCGGCPFLVDTPTPLAPGRMEEIVESLYQGGDFPCHKTIDYNETDDEGELTRQATRDSQFCAGALIFLEKRNRPNQLMRIAERLRMYNHRKLKCHDKVINHVKEAKTI